jgi:hypothetical protein
MHLFDMNIQMIIKNEGNTTAKAIDNEIVWLTDFCRIS